MSNFKESIKVDLNSTKKSSNRTSNRTSTSQKNTRTKTKKRIKHYRLTPKGKKFLIKSGIVLLLSSTAIPGCNYAINSLQNNQQSENAITQTLTDRLSNLPVIESDALTESELRQVEYNPVIENNNLVLKDRVEYLKDSLYEVEGWNNNNDVKNLFYDIHTSQMAILKYKIACAIGEDGYEINSQNDLNSLGNDSIQLRSNVDKDHPDDAYIIINTPTRLALSGEENLGPELNSLINKLCYLPATGGTYEDLKKLLDFDLSNVIIKYNPEDLTFSMHKCPDSKQQVFPQLQNHDDEER